MKIIDMATGKLPDVSAKQQSSQSNTSFESLFTEAEQRQTVNTTENQNDDENQNRSSETPQSNPPTYYTNSVEEEPEENAAICETPQYIAYDHAAPEEIVYIAPEEFLAKVAETMYVPEEKVTEWLNKTDLTTKDLAEPQAVVKFLQVALDAESPLELLKDEKFPEIYKALKEAVAETAVKPTAKDANATVKISAEAAEVLTDGIEATTSDGEVVVKAATKNIAATTDDAVPQALRQTEAHSEPVHLVAEQADANVPIEASANDAPPVNPAIATEIVTVRAEQSVQQAAPPPPVDPANVIEQIMNQVKLQATGGNFSEIRITLRPESLGDIVLRVMTQNGIVTAMFEAESQRVKEALEADFNSLRDALTEQGIKFSELSVYVRQDENERMNQFERARQNSRNRAESIEEVEEPEQISYHNGVIDLTA